MSNNTSNAKQLVVANIEKLIFILMCTPTKLAGPAHPDSAYGLPILIWGPPGIGKSVRAEAVAFASQLHYEAVNCAGVEPPDVNGVLSVEGGRVHRLPALPELANICDRGEGLLVFEELGTAPGMVQAACRMAMLERRFGSVRAPKRARFMATTNDPKHGGTGYVIEPQLSNRFAHIFLDVPSIEEVSDFYQDRNDKNLFMDKITDAEEAISRGWADTKPAMARLISAFLASTAGVGLLHKQPTEQALAAKPFPTPRTWEMVIRAFTTAHILNEFDVMSDEIAASLVGSAAASALSAYITTLELPTIEDILSGKWSPDVYKLDQCFLALGALGAHIKNAREKKKTIDGDAVWRVLHKVESAGQLDLAVSTVREALSIPGYSYRSSGMAKEATGIVRHLSKAGVLGAAGGLN